MKIEQFVVAYGVEQDRLRALLPQGISSLRPVLRINAELRQAASESAYIELNTAIEADGVRGFLNIGHWTDDSDGLIARRDGKSVTFSLPFLTVTFTGVGITGGCPAEKENAGCLFLGEKRRWRPVEPIVSPKEFCDCSFSWHYTKGDARGVSIGKTLPAIPSEPKIYYPPLALTPQNAAAIPCECVLGAYKVIFEREEKLPSDECPQK